jgi:hypothetical protein
MARTRAWRACSKLWLPSPGGWPYHPPPFGHGPSGCAVAWQCRAMNDVEVPPRQIEYVCPIDEAVGDCPDTARRLIGAVDRNSVLTRCDAGGPCWTRFRSGGTIRPRASLIARRRKHSMRYWNCAVMSSNSRPLTCQRVSDGTDGAHPLRATGRVPGRANITCHFRGRPHKAARTPICCRSQWNSTYRRRRPDSARSLPARGQRCSLLPSLPR